MRLVSLVPSWTETLVEAGVDVVGRTRYCIHPRSCVGGIPVVGGVRDVDWTRVHALRPDLVVADRGENPGDVVQRAGCPVFVSDVRSVGSLVADLGRLVSAIGPETAAGRRLGDMGARWRRQAGRARKLELRDLPGVRHWIKPPRQEVRTLLYLVWKDPWMAASRETFVGAMLGALGLGGLVPSFATPYAAVDLAAWDNPSVLLLLPSEPYPFGRAGEAEPVRALTNPCALVDGEAFCWYGIRSLRFLEALDRPARVRPGIRR